MQAKTFLEQDWEYKLGASMDAILKGIVEQYRGEGKAAIINHICLDLGISQPTARQWLSKYGVEIDARHD